MSYKSPRNVGSKASMLAMVTGVGATGFVIAGWSLFEFDAALLPYAQALVLSLTFTVYRLTLWAQRPATAAILTQARSSLFRRAGWYPRVRHLAVRCVGYFALNRFVWKRSKRRWATHWPIMVGCVMAMAIVLPLVLGWVWFETPPDDLHTYRVMLLGQPIRTIAVDSFEAFIAFHGLVWASIPVVIGTSVGLWRRSTDRGERATQTVGHDVVPLLILMAIAVTGLLMTLSYSFLEGQLHAPIAWLHMVLVVGTLVWIPYSKLIHIPQRVLKFAHLVYEHDADQSAPAICARCETPFATELQINDLVRVQQQLGYRYALQRAPQAGHYQHVCPRCRRSMLVMAQSRRWVNLDFEHRSE